MKRRDFIKLSFVTGSAVLMPSFSYGANLNLNDITFSTTTYQDNAAQTIIVFMYGGASQLSGNISNLEEINQHSQHNYSYFSGTRATTATTHNCWKAAGGDHMEDLIAAGDMTLYRCCYSQEREDANNKSHGLCTNQNQRGTYDIDGGGIVANIATILRAKGMINENTLMPFVTMEGESTFYTEGNIPLASYLKPVGVDERFNNPYSRSVNPWLFCTDEERQNNNCTDSNSDYIPKLTTDMDILSQSYNQNRKIKNAFTKRGELSSFIEDNLKSKLDAQGNIITPVEYPTNNFSNKLKAAITLLDANPDTKIVTLGTGGLGGWDDHNDANRYVKRMDDLFGSLKAAVAHLKAINKDDTINIMVFGEFGRNVNLNASNGWDHGNLQNFYVLGGKGYFTHRGIVGETVVDNAGYNRIWLKPKSGTYWFEPLSIASTLYSIYGIENPNILTGGNYPPVNIV